MSENLAAALDRALEGTDVKKSLQGSFPRLGTGEFTLKFVHAGFENTSKGLIAKLKWTVHAKMFGGKVDDGAVGRQWAETYSLWVKKDDGKGGQFLPFLGRLVDDLKRVQSYLPDKLFENSDHFRESTGARLQEVFDKLNDAGEIFVSVVAAPSKDGKNEYRNMRFAKRDDTQSDGGGESPPDEVVVADESPSLPDVGTPVTFTHGGKAQKGTVVKVDGGKVSVKAKIGGKDTTVQFADPFNQLTWEV